MPIFPILDCNDFLIVKLNLKSVGDCDSNFATESNENISLSTTIVSDNYISDQRLVQLDETQFHVMMLRPNVPVHRLRIFAAHVAMRTLETRQIDTL